MGPSHRIHAKEDLKRTENGKNAEVEKYFHLKDDICLNDVHSTTLQVWSSHTPDDWQTEIGGL